MDSCTYDPVITLICRISENFKNVNFLGKTAFLVLGRIIDAELPEPDIVICSGHGIHTYWKLEEPLHDMEKWRQVQQRMNSVLDADRTIQNPERIRLRTD